MRTNERAPPKTPERARKNPSLVLTVALMPLMNSLTEKLSLAIPSDSVTPLALGKRLPLSGFHTLAVSIYLGNFAKRSEMSETRDGRKKKKRPATTTATATYMKMTA